jgi:FkbM family methyltransferase
VVHAFVAGLILATLMARVDIYSHVLSAEGSSSWTFTKAKLGINGCPLLAPSGDSPWSSSSTAQAAGGAASRLPGRTGRVSAFLKKAGCLVGNMIEPPFFKGAAAGGWTHKVVIDIGANDGMDYAVTSVKSGHHTVFSFEPSPATAAVFRQTMAKKGLTRQMTVVNVHPGRQAVIPDISRQRRAGQGWIFLIIAAAGAETGVQQLHTPLTPTGSLVASLTTENADPKTNGKQSKAIDVAVVKVDDVLRSAGFDLGAPARPVKVGIKSNGFDSDTGAGQDGAGSDRAVDPIYLMKIDTQGNELDGLKGAVDLLNSKYAPEIINLEFWPVGMRRGGKSPLDVLTLMSDHGYTCFDWSQNQHVPITRPSDFEGFINAFYDRAVSPKCSGFKCWTFGLWDEVVCTRL